MSDAPKKKPYATLLAAAIAVIFLGQPYWGALLVIWVAGWAFRTAYAMLQKPADRAEEIVKAVIWVIAFSLVAAIHLARLGEIRHKADAVVAEIKDYATRHGHYPTNPEEIGLTHDVLKKRLGVSGDYRNSGNRAILVYDSTFFAFARYTYEFASNEWWYDAD